MAISFPWLKLSHESRAIYTPTSWLQLTRYRREMSRNILMDGFRRSPIWMEDEPSGIFPGATAQA